MEFNYIPNQKKKKGPKEIISNVKEMPKNMMEKIKKTVEEMKKKGQKLTPELKKLLTKALAGSLVAGMLFMAGCAKTPVEQAYSRDIAKLIDSVDYEEKLNEYNDYRAEIQRRIDGEDNNYQTVAGDAETSNPFNTPIDFSNNLTHWGEGYLNLKSVPEDYYLDKLNVPAEDIHMYTQIASWFTTDEGDLYMCVYAYDDYWEKSEGYYVLKTLFKYNIGDKLCKELGKVYDKKDNSYGQAGSYAGGFLYRYLLNFIIENYNPEILAEMYGFNDDDCQTQNSFPKKVRIYPCFTDSMVTFKNGYMQIYSFADNYDENEGGVQYRYRMCLAEYPDIKKDVISDSQMHNGVIIVPPYDALRDFQTGGDGFKHLLERNLLGENWFNTLYLTLEEASELKNMGYIVDRDQYYRDVDHGPDAYFDAIIKDYQDYTKSREKN